MSSSRPVLFDEHGGYRLTAAQRTCIRCHHVLVDEDERGLYYQVPVADITPPDVLRPGSPEMILTFADRVHECAGQPHALPGEPAAGTGDRS